MPPSIATVRVVAIRAWLARFDVAQFQECPVQGANRSAQGNALGPREFQGNSSPVGAGPTA